MSDADPHPPLPVLSYFATTGDDHTPAEERDSGASAAELDVMERLRAVERAMGAEFSRALGRSFFALLAEVRDHERSGRTVST